MSPDRRPCDDTAVGWTGRDLSEPDEPDELRHGWKLASVTAEIVSQHEADESDTAVSEVWWEESF